MATLTDRIEVVLSMLSDNFTAGAAKGEEGLQGITSKSNVAQSALGALGVGSAEGGGALEAGLGPAAAAAGGIALIGKFALDGVKDFASLTGEVRGFQRVTGATAETSSQMVEALKLVGVDAQAGDTAMGRFAQRIGQGKTSLDSYGIAVKENHDGSVDMVGTLENVSEKFRSIPDATQRAALGMDLFGKGWQTLLPLLMKGKDGIQQFMAEASKSGVVFSQADLERGKQYSLAMKELGTTLEGLKISVGEIAAPAITGMSTSINQAIQTTNSALGPLGGIAGVGTDIAKSMNYGVGAFKELDAVTKLAQGDFGGFASSAAQGIPIIGQFFGGGSDGANMLKTSTDKANTATATAVELALEGKTKTQAYKDAISQAGSANNDLAGAQVAVTTALNNQADALVTTTSDMLGYWSAANAAALANDAVAAAQLKYHDAQKKVFDTKGQDVQANVDLARSQDEYTGTVIKAVDAAGKAAAAKDVGKDKSVQARDATKAEIDTLNYLAGTTDGPVRQAILDHIAVLGKIPPTATTNVQVNVDKSQLDQLQNTLNGLKNAAINIVANVTGAGANALNGRGP